MKTEKKYCASPWRGLHLNFEGQIKTCCAGLINSKDLMLDDLSTTKSIESVLQNAKFKEIKESIKQGKLHHEYCVNCIQREDAGGRSERDWHNNINKDFDVQTANLDEHKPSLVDLRWNNTCNLACTYCDPYFSTKWASIMGQSENKSIKSHYTKVVDYIDEHKQYVKEVALVGGEPLLMKENVALLKVLTDDVSITLLTNMSVNLDTNLVVKQLLNRSKVNWNMSFDNINERFEYVRYGGVWEQMNKNVTVISDRINNTTHNGGIHAVYNIYSCTRLCELRKYAIEKKIEITWQQLDYPEHLNPTNHNAKVRQLAIEEIRKYKSMFEVSDEDLSFLDATVSLLQKGNIDKGKEFLDFTEELENKYHPTHKGKFKELWTELMQTQIH